jgi:sugar phosphate isomerase/epimerase
MLPSLSRRRALAISAATAAGATWFNLPAFFERTLAAADANYYGGFPLGAQSYSLRNFDTRECVRHLQGLGLQFVEMYSKHFNPQASEAEIAENLKLLEDANVHLQGHGVHGFSANHEANRQLFTFAKRVGVTVITADPAPDSFESLTKLVTEFDIRIAIHNHGPGHRYDKLSSVVAALEGKHPSLGACVDTGHFIRSGEDPVNVIRTLGARVFAAHLKDERDFGKRASHNVVLGKGHLDVVGVFKALKDVNFPAFGSLSLEYEANPQNPLDDMKACLEVTREALAKIAAG